MQITVRTFNTRKEVLASGYTEINIIKCVELPLDALIKIRKWAKEHQVALLKRKYSVPGTLFVDEQQHNLINATELLFKELEPLRARSEDEQIAVDFLITSNRVNPELIDLEVAAKVLNN